MREYRGFTFLHGLCRGGCGTRPYRVAKINGPIPSVFLDKLTAKITALIHTAMLKPFWQAVGKYICLHSYSGTFSYGLPLYFRIGFDTPTKSQTKFQTPSSITFCIRSCSKWLAKLGDHRSSGARRRG